MYIKTILQTFVVGACVLEGAALGLGRVGSREWRAVRDARRRNVNEDSTLGVAAVEVPGLENLISYVCPTNAAKRQINVVSGSTGTAVPVADLLALFQQLQAVLAQIEAILKANGLYTSTAASLVPVATSFSTVMISIPQASTIPGTQYITSVLAAATLNAGTVQYLTTQAVDAPLLVTEGTGGLVYVTVTSTSTVFMDPVALTTIQVAQTEQSPVPALTTMAAAGSTTLNSNPQQANPPQAIVTTTTSSIKTVLPVSILTTPIAATTPVAAVPGTTPAQSTTSASEEDDEEDDCWDDEDTTTFASTVVATSTATFASVVASSTTNNEGIFVQTSIGVSSSVAAAATSNSGYLFSSQSSKNVAVYFGQTPVTSTSSLLAQCADANIDIAILAFVVSNSYQGTIYPLVNYGAACGGQTDAMIASAPGLLSCPDLAAMITTCQTTYGKKVMMSIGGSASGISFTAASQATAFADILWQLFGPPGLVDINLRPFGNASIDGFDIDNEDNLPANFDVLGSQLKANYAKDTDGKKYYLSSAPQCPFPDASDPSALILNCDFVFVQFYNNAPCEIGSTGFNASLSQWSTYLETSTNSVKPRLYVGAPAWSAAGASAYAHIGSPKGIEIIAEQIAAQHLSNFGGIMFWDGAEGMLNAEGGKDIIAWAKAGLDN